MHPFSFTLILAAPGTQGKGRRGGRKLSTVESPLSGTPWDQVKVFCYRMCQLTGGKPFHNYLYQSSCACFQSFSKRFRLYILKPIHIFGHVFMVKSPTLL